MKNSSRKFHYLFALALMCLIGFGIQNDAQAQGKRGMKKNNMSPTEMAAKKTEKMTKHLGLDAVQASKVLTINEKYMTQMVEAKQTKGDRSAKWEKIKTIMDAQSAELKSVLTTEQYAKIESKIADKKAKRQDRMDRAMEKAGTPEERAEKHTAKLAKKLNLDAGQTAKIKAINLKYAQKRQALKGTDNRREAMKSMKDAQQTEIKAVLSTEQAAQFDEIMSKRGKRGEHRRGQKRGGHKKGVKQDIF